MRQESTYQQIYKAACAKIKELQRMACDQCGGFGYINPDMPSIQGVRSHSATVDCPLCQGTGLKTDAP